MGLDMSPMKISYSLRRIPLADFTFWLRLSLSLNFGQSAYLSQKVKWTLSYVF